MREFYTREKVRMNRIVIDGLEVCWVVISCISVAQQSVKWICVLVVCVFAEKGDAGVQRKPILC